MFGILPFALGVQKRPFSNKQFVGDEIPPIQMHQSNGERKRQIATGSLESFAWIPFLLLLYLIRR